MICENCKGSISGEICMHCATVATKEPSQTEINLAYKNISERFKKPRFITGFHVLIVLVLLTVIVLSISLPIALRTPPTPPMQAFYSSSRRIGTGDTPTDSSFGGHATVRQYIDNLIHLTHFNVSQSGTSGNVTIEFLNMSNMQINRIYFAVFGARQNIEVFCLVYSNHRIFVINEPLQPGQRTGRVVILNYWRNINSTHSGLIYVRVVFQNGTDVTFCTQMRTALFNTRLMYR